MQTKIIMRLLAFICFMLLVAPSHAMRTVNDPLQDYLSTKLSSLTQGDYIFTLTVDLNEDGVEDVFYSSSADEDIVSKRGAQTWTSYLSTAQGYQVADIGDVVSKTHEVLTLNTASASLQRLGNGKLALMYLFIGVKGSGTNIAYFIDDNNRLKKLVVSRLKNDAETERSIEFSPVEESIQKIQESAQPIEVVLSSEQLSQVKTADDDFFADKRLRSDSGSGKLFYLYSKDLSAFLGIKEDRREAMIPIGVIGEPIRTLITKRAEARIKGIELKSEQDQEELKQILIWFDEWHKKYGARNKFYQGLAKQLAEGKQIVPEDVMGQVPVDQRQLLDKTEKISSEAMQMEEEIQFDETRPSNATVTQNASKKHTEKQMLIVIAILVMAVIVGLIMFVFLRKKKEP